VTLEEEQAYSKLKNELIEIKLGAAEALPLLLESVRRQQELIDRKRIRK
jgi:hypothetical protein